MKTPPKPDSFNDTVAWVNYLNYIVGIGLIAWGIIDVVTSPLSPWNWLYPLYYCIFGMMLISAQHHFAFIDRNFLFLHHYFGRGLFTTYLGTLFVQYFEDGNFFFKVGSYAACAILMFCGLV
mmetsp:Transcript_7413/g.6756  ORF Transcript_7413/g.6756 Transcript_7413/m.6756 type:complete len:122 (-) Transcript_7413:115-480(-)